MGKAILILLDACGYDAAARYAGTLEQAVEAGACAKYKATGRLPSLSRPMYETILTGLEAGVHGIFTNDTRRPSRCPNLFSLCRQQGLTTAAAAYGWMRELYIGDGPFDPARQRFCLDGEGAIQHGIFYCEDQYPDSHLFADADFLVDQYRPDFLLIHPMNIDYAGHRHGSESVQYRYSVMNAGLLITARLEAWREMGYSVVVTADHGMDAQGIHGGTLPEQRDVPIYIFSDAVEYGDFSAEPLSQLTVAPLLCALLGLSPAAAMIPNQIRRREP